MSALDGDTSASSVREWPHAKITTVVAVMGFLMTLVTAGIMTPGALVNVRALTASPKGAATTDPPPQAERVEIRPNVTNTITTYNQGLIVIAVGIGAETSQRIANQEAVPGVRDQKAQQQPVTGGPPAPPTTGSDRNLLAELDGLIEGQKRDQNQLDEVMKGLGR